MTGQLPDRFKVRAQVMQHVLAQIHSRESLQELTRLGPEGYNWLLRVEQTSKTLLPLFVEKAPYLVHHLLLTFNSPAKVFELLKQDLPREVDSVLLSVNAKLAAKFRTWMEEMLELSANSASIVPNLASQQISAEATRYLVSKDGLGDLIFDNGNSIYPDLILKGYDYSFLPFQSSSNPIDGPCLKNRQNPKPSNVPDGCEIKTCESDRIKVDAHGAHPGLHIGVTWKTVRKEIVITDVLVAYIRIADYTVSDGRVDVTTKKRSFGHSSFLSLLFGR